MNSPHDDFLAAELVATTIAEAREGLAKARAEILDAPPPSTPDLQSRALAVLAFAECAIGDASARARAALEEWRAGRIDLAELRARAGEPSRVCDDIAGALVAVGMTAKRSRPPLPRARG